MLTVLILFMNVVITGFALYLFDYSKDGSLNNIPIMILCVILSIVATSILVWLFIEVFYLLLPKGKIQKSMIVHKIAKQIASVPFHLSRIKIKVTGLEHLPKDSGFTIYSNHNSWIDPTLIMNALYHYPVAGLGKESAFKIPVIGKFAPKLGFVKIHREDVRQSAIAIKTVTQRVQEGYCMIIFPEGTRNPNYNTVLDFKAGAFKAALKSQRPIVPITLVRPAKRKWRLFTPIQLVIHKSLKYDEFKSLKTHELSKKVQEVIITALLKI